MNNAEAAVIISIIAAVTVIAVDTDSGWPLALVLLSFLFMMR